MAHGNSDTGTALSLPDGLNADALPRYLKAHVPELGELEGADLIGGGRSNLTYRLRTSKGTAVLRRPPLGHILPSAHDMGREFRFISALAGTPVPVPPAIALCEDESVVGQKFYLMGYVPGRTVSQEWPANYGADADQGRTSAALVETLAAIHSIDWQAVGLGDFQRPGSYVERQVKRLSSQYELSVQEPLPAMAELKRRLERALPPQTETRIVHGDYAIHNVLLAEDDPGRIVAVLDWELAAIGDPLADLGWMLAMWARDENNLGATEAPVGTHPVTLLPGFWTRSQVIDAYARVSGRDVSMVEFYHVLALYKLVVIWAGIDARFKAGAMRGEGFEVFEARVPAGAERALAIADGSSIPALRGQTT